MKKIEIFNGCYLSNFKKTFKIMRIGLFIFLVSALQTFASNTYSQRTRLSLNITNTKLVDVMDQIERQTEFYFLFNEKLIDTNRKVSVSVKDQKIDKILDDLFAGTDVTYTITDRKIILAPSFLTNRAQQQKTVSGTVTDEKGEPVPGVNVVIKGTTKGTITDVDGKYTISDVPDNATLEFSFIGMQTQDVIVGNQSVINVTMKFASIGLDEVVSVGYATQKKVTLTGSVSNVNNKVITRSPAVNVTNALSGLMPGLITLNRSGEPGADMSKMYIRGINTTGSNAPLVVVDGVQNPPGWERINPDNIKSVSVLKDASAAIYGSRAANGVIIITTKSGFSGKPVITYSGNYGVVQPTKIPELANSGLFAETVNQILVEQGQLPRFSDEDIKKYYAGNDPNYPSYNWYNDILKNSTYQQLHNLSIRGGNDAIKYSIAGSYSNQNSIFKNGIHDFKGYTMQSKIDAKVTKNIGVHLDVNATWNNRIAPGATRNPFYWFRAEPMVPVYWKEGYPSTGAAASGYNPAMMVSTEAGEKKYTNNNLTSKFAFDIAIPWVDGLKVDGYFVYMTDNNHVKNWQTPYITYDYDKDNDEYIPMQSGNLSSPQLSEDFYISKNPFFNLRVAYEKQFGKHYISAFIAGEQQTTTWHTVSASRNNYSSKLIPELFAGDPETQTNTGSTDKRARQSLFGRLSYNFKEKYLVDFNIRYDGSSVFPPGKRFGTFPGASVAWAINKENFLENSSSISLLKLRASVGQMGNDIIPAYQWLNSYTMRVDHGYLFGEDLHKTQGLYQIVEANPNITWEVATTSNIGIDMGLWQNSLSFSVDLFKQKRNNILAKRNLSIPVFTYLELPDENIGVMQNSGIDFIISTRNKPKVKGFQYSISANVSYNKSKIINVDESPNIPDYQKKEGHIIGADRYYHALGIIRTEDQLNSLPLYPGTRVGDLYYEDVDGDGEISAADMKTMDKSDIPRITYGLNFTLAYNNFSLFANFAGQGKAWMFFYQNMREGGWNALSELLENRYTPGSMDSKYPNLPYTTSPGKEVSGLYSDFWLQNTAFVRLKTLELAYDFPKKWMSKIDVSSLKLYLNGTNLFTLTKVKWFDPESNDMSGAYYPQNRIFNIGVRLSF